MANTIHNDQYGLTLAANAFYWAAYFKSEPGVGVSGTPTVVPVQLRGCEPFLELCAPNGIYANEWWLLDEITAPRARGVTNTETKVKSIVLADIS